MEDVFKFVIVMFTIMGIPAMFMWGAPIARALARRIEGGRGVDASEMDAMRSELEELRALPARVAELEERLDFAERLLTRQEAMDRLPGERLTGGH